MNIQILKINKVKVNPNNPRLIKDDNFKRLVQSIIQFPTMLEIRPIVVNKDMIIIGGNMRYKACLEAGVTEIPVIIAKDLTPEQEREFIIKDNVSGGEWDWDMLANEWETEKLANWGLDIPDFDKVDDLEDGEEIEFAQSVQLIPPKEYILILCEPNSEDWEDLKGTLKLAMVRRGGYKKGSAFDAVALERVIEWKDFKKRYNVDSSTEQK
jgi:hypothetical protein